MAAPVEIPLWLQAEQFFFSLKFCGLLRKSSNLLDGILQKFSEVAVSQFPLRIHLFFMLGSFLYNVYKKIHWR